jgi:predicted RNase H-like nuclease
MTITIIGIDCAVDERNVGVAIGNYTDGICNLISLPGSEKACSVSEVVCNWINPSTRVLLALDAPLGWPVTLGTALSSHLAGGGIKASPDLLFRRATDRFVKVRLKKQPLDVGADRIARTAKAALDLLNQVRNQTGLPVPLVWNAAFTGPAGAIEVYPAGTLVSYGLPSSGYKKKNQALVRKQILRGLESLIKSRVELEDAENNADVLDAIVCVLSGADFLRDRSYFPEDPSEALKEGWIWVKRKEEAP